MAQEMLLNGCRIEEPVSTEFAQLQGIVQWLRDAGWEPYRTETCLFSCRLALAGQADALFRNDRNQFAILDWKRSKAIRFECPFRRLREPLGNLEECNGWLYSLQLNVYRWILESEYFLDVAMMALGQVHPELSAPRLIRVPRIAEEMDLLIEHQVEMGLAWPDPSPGENAPFVLPAGETKHMQRAPAMPNAIDAQEPR